MGDRAIRAFESTRAMAEAEVAIAELHIPPLVIALVNGATVPEMAVMARVLAGLA